MLVLAVDTSTPFVTAGLVTVTEDAVNAGPQRLTEDSRAHNEVLTPSITECLAEAEATPADLDAVVVGCGPGPFTGLRVGMVTAAAFADALHIPCYGVCSLDAIGYGVGSRLVVTDARRREVYWAVYNETGQRIFGPAVNKPADVAAELETRMWQPEAVAGSPEHCGMFAVPPLDAAPSPLPVDLVRVAQPLFGTEPEPLVPMYLRRPDAKEPKPVEPSRAITGLPGSAVPEQPEQPEA
ncbi:tRNA (adenosine(37)-N6)-threonylcarbamoyltransferase complex dimerization subunit type 1 TsaB [Corynebacterium ulceribovis]|uniref:tRNA (adenosine(37)-N6)-threonylcarbamoyltransferase complex dimerization subunit type 1 TsaB n=1 Tax=Corynebacterium ulceribovis TaxID=487732 RepID=UPI000380A6B1|nr:tRNA (adenosine(37)-N6)-threonylcarbamoyltransferase complex dimerization subunit type 1 TsaB [Corynebacterium ulceribovis]